MTGEQPYRPASSRAGALENLDAARESFEAIGDAVQGRSRLTAAQIAEAGVGVLMVMVPVARGLVWAVLDVADAVRETATPPPPDVRVDPWPVSPCVVCAAGIRCESHPAPCGARHAAGSNVRCVLPDRHDGYHDDRGGNVWSSCCDDTPGHDGECAWRVS